ncbi:FG-GAP repeat domain-containing protein [Streptomyces sp. NBC_00239]|uniref:FG-GAP repeat domain-containing protein n=1 Tax=Streptomyces sp. NBC_00239 TaxID=2903640 RepID=UPI002E2989DB|nr:VCBS repeat-containing protein [Streptomyces sp. NBC_00239]
MGRTARPQRRHHRGAAAFVTASLVLGAAAVLPAGTAHAAAAPAPWSGVKSLSSANSVMRELVVATSGIAVTAWDEYDATAGLYRLYVAARPADSDTWGPRTELGTSKITGREVKLLARADGSVLALWTERPNQPSEYTGTKETLVRTATLPAGATTGWSAPYDLIGPQHAGVQISSVDLVEGPGGRLGATWLSIPTIQTMRAEVVATTRGTDGTWTPAGVVSNIAQYPGAVASAPQITLDANGGAVVAYTMNESANATVMTNSRAAETGAWGTPARFTTPSTGTREPTLATDPFGWTYMVWRDAAGTFQMTHRSSAGADWSQPQTVVSGVGDPLKTPEPLLAPDGDISLVWFDRSSANRGVRAASFESSNGTWGGPQNLNTAFPNQQIDVSMARDGSVHVVWPQSSPSSSITELLHAVRGGSSWSAAKELPAIGSGGDGDALHGEIAAVTADKVTAVWDPRHAGQSTRVIVAARTAWPKLAVEYSLVQPTADLKGSTSTSLVWQPTWTMNTPVSSWTLTLTDPAGKTLRTLTGAAGTTTIAAAWNGRTSSGTLAPNGRHTWTLKAVHAGSGVSSTVATGPLSVTGGAAVFRDFGGHNDVPDGLGDILTLTSTGKLEYLYGQLPKGDFEVGKSGTGWSSSIKVVPFGDLTGDRCNDLLVRTGESLRLYKPACGAAPTTNTAYTVLGTAGWGQYDVMTAVGDVTKDGRPDMLARTAATGAVYLYKGTAEGKLAARVKLFADWRGYKKVIGTGDLNGDGVGDLIAQDKSNELWRLDGTGAGTFKTRVKLADDWGSSYNLLLGPGDLNGDGKADMLARDTAGNLYRYLGTGKGTFAARTKAMIGLNAYKALF